MARRQCPPRQPELAADAVPVVAEALAAAEVPVTELLREVQPRPRVQLPHPHPPQPLVAVVPLVLQRPSSR